MVVPLVVRRLVSVEILLVGTLTPQLLQQAPLQFKWLMGLGLGRKLKPVSSVTNSIVRLSLTQPTALFNAATAKAYGIEGACDASLASTEYVTVSVPGESLSEQVTCGSQNTFSVDLDALSLGEGLPFKVKAEYGGVSFETTPITNSIVDLAINPLGAFNTNTLSTYSISGACDFSVSAKGDVTVRREDNGY